jgi:rhodanese-related sulfurtransferase
MGSSPQPLLVDVREPYELESELGRIDGVLNIPIGELSSHIDELESHREKEMVMVCRSGARAHTAAQILTKAGFPSVSVLAGGMLAWLKA